jgi:hypothetical protein
MAELQYSAVSVMTVNIQEGMSKVIVVLLNDYPEHYKMIVKIDIYQP